MPISNIWINNKSLKWLIYVYQWLRNNQKKTSISLKRFMTFSQAWQTFAKLLKVSALWWVWKTNSGQLCQEKQINQVYVVKTLERLVLTRVGWVIGVSRNRSQWRPKKWGEAIVEHTLGTYVLKWESLDMVSNSCSLHACYGARISYSVLMSNRYF